MLTHRPDGSASSCLGRPGVSAAGGLALLVAALCAVDVAPASAQDAAAPTADAPAAPTPAAPTLAAPSAATPPVTASPTANLLAGILSRDAFTALLDVRFVVSNGATSFVDGGFGKARFDGNGDGGFKAQVVPAEADLIWNPRFTSSLTGNVSLAAQKGQENTVDVLEAFLTYLPQQTGSVSFSARAGLMWPEISLEHSTGGAWSVVNTITPSAINSWVGEEVKVVGLEGTLHASIKQHELAFTGAIFEYNDTDGTLLSFRGWSLSDLKSTAEGHFPLPPLNAIVSQFQANETRSTINIDNRPGFYVRLDWRPPQPVDVNLFYYDNRANPKALTPSEQWGWRTRFFNLGLNADLTPSTRLLVQGMTGSTIMGYDLDGIPWVHTVFNSAYALVTQSVGPLALTGRIEAFSTNEHGSLMPQNNSENGWAMTAAARMPLTSHMSLFLEALNVRSSRGTRVDLGGLSSSFEAQTVLQAALRIRL